MRGAEAGTNGARDLEEKIDRRSFPSPHTGPVAAVHRLYFSFPGLSPWVSMLVFTW